MIKPSEVDLGASFPPLVGTMGHTEAELAAALLVRACQVNGDAWQDISIAQILEVVAADIEANRQPIAAMNRNPFCRPDAYDLVKRGFAEWVADPGQALRLTQRGLDVLAAKVVRR